MRRHLATAALGLAIAATQCPASRSDPDAAPPPPPPLPPPVAAAHDLPATYPRDADLDTIHRWLRGEFTRIARDARREQLRLHPVNPGSCAGPIIVLPTLEALPPEEWRRLAARCADDLSDPDRARRVAAVHLALQLGQLTRLGGPPALLTDALRAGLAALTTDADPDTRALALHAQATVAGTCATPGPELRAAIAALAAADAQTRRAAARSLADATVETPPGTDAFGDLGPDAIKRLLPLCDDDDRMTRMAAIRLLARTGDRLPPLLPNFEVWLGDPDRTRRGATLMAVESMGERGAPLTPRLVRMALDPACTERMRAINALGRLGAAGDAAVQTLATLAADDDPMIASSARLALARLGPAAAPAAPLLRELARTDPENARECLWAADILEGKRRFDDPYPCPEASASPN